MSNTDASFYNKFLLAFHRQTLHKQFQITVFWVVTL